MAHRNSQKRFYEDYNVYFITTNTERRCPFFKEEFFCELFVQNLRVCKVLKGFGLFAFTINHDHVHLLIMGNERYNISQVLHSIKRVFSHDINSVLGYGSDFNKLLGVRERLFSNESEVYKPRFQNDNPDFKQVLQNYINDLKRIRSVFISKYTRCHTFLKFKWQKSFHDHTIRINKTDFKNHVHYIVSNCVKHKICEDFTKYRWTSINEEFRDLIDDFMI